MEKKFKTEVIHNHVICLKTNFQLTDEIESMIEMLNGIVESQGEKYHYHYLCGEMFDAKEINQKVEAILTAYVNTLSEKDDDIDRIKEFAEEKELYKFLSSFMKNVKITIVKAKM